MRKILRKIAILGLFAGMLFPVATSNVAVQAAGDDPSYSNESFLGLKPWYDGLTTSSGLKTPKTECPSGSYDCVELKTYIWTIVFNVLTDLTLLGAYLTIGFVLYGGYQYILSSGSTEKALRGKKTIYTAFIGLAIILLASVIFNVIKYAFLKGSGDTETITTADGIALTIPNTSADLLFINALQWIIGIAGLVAVIFIVYGGCLYVSSRGEPTKIETAKKSIIYAVIGLFIVGVSQVITGFVSSNIRAARDSAINGTSLIIEEDNNKLI